MGARSQNHTACKKIHEMNRLTDLPECKLMKTKDPADGDVAGYHKLGWKIVCEDPRLSLPMVGKMIKVIDLVDCPPHKFPQALTPAELQVFLDICAATLDIERAPTMGKSEENIKWPYSSNPTFHKAREVLTRLSAL